MTTPAYIPVNHKRFDLDPYLVVGSMPREMPVVAVSSNTFVTVGTHSTAVARENQLGIDLQGSAPHMARWIADPAKLTDAGDGSYHWHTSQGDLTGAYWRFDAASMPVVDPTYSWKLRDKSHPDLEYPAFLFQGSMWGQLHGFADQAEFTAIIVARLHGTNGGHWANVFASVYSGADPDTHMDVALQGRNDTMRTLAIQRYVQDTWANTGRPLMIATQQNSTLARQIIWDNNRSSKHFRHAGASGYDMRWFIARDGGQYVDSRTMVMDVIDICLYTTYLDTADINDRLHKLNSIYGVLG